MMIDELWRKAARTRRYFKMFAHWVSHWSQFLDR
jgi:hypothetical protein